MVGVGIIGTGWFGSEHARALAELSQARLLGVCGASLESAQVFARQYGAGPMPSPRSCWPRLR